MSNVTVKRAPHKITVNNTPQQITIIEDGSQGPPGIGTQGIQGIQGIQGPEGDITAELQQLLDDQIARGSPRLWTFEGNGVATEFFLPGADITDPLFYEVFVADPDIVGGAAQQPVTNYSIVIAVDPEGSKVVLTAAPGNLVKGWVILRAYPQEAPVDWLSGLLGSDTFLTMLRNLITNTLYESEDVLRLGAVRSLIPLRNVSFSGSLDGRDESYLIRTTGGLPTTLTIRANTGNALLDWETNPIAVPYFSVLQRGDGAVTIAGEPGVTITPPPGYLAKPRAKGSVITLTGDYMAGGEWVCSGDMAVA